MSNIRANERIQDNSSEHNNREYQIRKDNIVSYKRISEQQTGEAKSICENQTKAIENRIEAKTRIEARQRQEKTREDKRR